MAPALSAEFHVPFLYFDLFHFSFLISIRMFPAFVAVDGRRSGRNGKGEERMGKKRKKLCRKTFDTVCAASNQEAISEQFDDIEFALSDIIDPDFAER
jgi:hypothetical protein